jgi:hypothetical protein
MIAIREDDPSRITREDAYALRRILVRRLQRATRGIPRPLRARYLRQFGQEWHDLAVTGKFPALHRRLARSRQAQTGAIVPETRASGESPRVTGLGAPPCDPSLVFRLASGLGASDTARVTGDSPRGESEERARGPVPAPVPERSQPLQAELFECAVPT